MTKTSELIGAELDFYVAKAIGYMRVGYLNTGELVGEEKVSDLAWDELAMIPAFSTGACNEFLRLIEKYEISLTKCKYRNGILCEPYWLARWTNPIDSVHYKHSSEGETPQIAGCRAIVAMKYGESVDD